MATHLKELSSSSAIVLHVGNHGSTLLSWLVFTASSAGTIGSGLCRWPHHMPAINTLASPFARLAFHSPLMLGTACPLRSCSSRLPTVSPSARSSDTAAKAAVTCVAAVGGDMCQPLHHEIVAPKPRHHCGDSPASSPTAAAAAAPLVIQPFARHCSTIIYVQCLSPWPGSAVPSPTPCCGHCSCCFTDHSPLPRRCGAIASEKILSPWPGSAEPSPAPNPAAVPPCWGWRPPPP